MHLFGPKDFSGDTRGAIVAIHELHNELNDVRASLRDSLARESVLARRCALLEAQLRRRR